MNSIEYRALDATVVCGDDRTDTVTISTGMVDRFNTVLNPKGWKLDAYMKNPVVLWAHQRTELPIGQAKRVFTEGDRLRAKVKWVDAELNPFAETVRKFYEQGLLRAFSVGFVPLKVREPGPGAKKDDPVYIDELELVEFSAVPVPANAEALKAMNRSLDPWMLRSFDDRRCLPREVVMEISGNDVVIEIEG